jgi:hypothetical protein
MWCESGLQTATASDEQAQELVQAKSKERKNRQAKSKPPTPKTKTTQALMVCHKIQRGR